jgi:hypothetical protein
MSPAEQATRPNSAIGSSWWVVYFSTNDSFKPSTLLAYFSTSADKWSFGLVGAMVAIPEYF